MSNVGKMGFLIPSQEIGRSASGAMRIREDVRSKDSRVVLIQALYQYCEILKGEGLVQKHDNIKRLEIEARDHWKDEDHDWDDFAERLLESDESKDAVVGVFFSGGLEKA
jgi:hypothetical protein